MKNILIVDDIKVNLKVLEVLLTRNGYDTTSALGGKDALGLLQIKPVDLIISDILMPEMDGFQFCRLCKLDENLKHIPLVFYSSTHTEDKARKLARKVGAHSLIVKPADPALLLKTIDDILENPSAAPGATATAPHPHIHNIKAPPETAGPEDFPETAAPQQPPALLKNIPCTVWTMDIQGNLPFISPAVEHITGFTEKEMKDMGKRGWLNRIDPAHAKGVKTACKNLYRKKIPLDIEYRFECRDGDFIWIHEKSGPPYTRNGKRYADGVSIDISEKKYIQAHRRKSAEDQLITTFAGGAAHDLNTLLTGISGYIELSRMNGTTPLEQERFLSNALKISNQASELTRDFFTLTAGREIGTCDALLGDVAAGAARRIPADGPTACKLEIPPDLWPCRVSSRMSQALENIIANAVESLGVDGFIEIVLQNVSLNVPADISGTVVPRGEYIKTTIRDNGRGIDKDHLHQIFHPYFTTKPRDMERGVGLGLTLSRTIIHQHDGVITVTSREGSGTTMNVYLPARRPGGGIREKNAAETPLTDTRRVMVVDEDQMVRDITLQLLSRAGFETTCVKNGREAATAYQQALRDKMPFHTVILSLMTRDDPTGINTLKQLRRIHPGVRIIVSSPYPGDRIIRQYRKYGFNAAVSRPYVAGELVNALNSLSVCA